MTVTAPTVTSCEPGAPVPGGVVPLSVPEMRGNEWKYVKECLDSNWVSSVGPFVDRFEQEVARRLLRKHAVATCTGTAALHVALQVAGVKPDEEVLVPALTFIAPANAVRYLGAWPVFMDAEPDYWQMDVAKVGEFLARRCVRRNGMVMNVETGRRVAAIVPVHILGHPVDLDPLMVLAREYELPVVEDAAESLGTRYKDRPVGCAGLLACLSFNGNKLITTGGGGMIVTDDAQLAQKAKYLTTQAKDDPLEYVHDEVGYNYRLTNLQAAMGCAQLERLDDYIAVKRIHAREYGQAFRDVPGILPMPEAPWALSTFWLYTIRVRAGEFGRTGRELMRDLGGMGIQTRPLWQPLHRSQAHAGCMAYCVEVADRLHKEALSLPCSVGLREADRERVIAAITSF